MRPVKLAANTFEHQYRGGSRIAALRGLTDLGEFCPEEWLGATSGLFLDPTTGPSRDVQGRLLREVIAADPIAWLGQAHLAGGPGDSGLLFKLLDAAQRLPVHVHPDRTFAAEHLHSPYGKTEAWLVLHAEPDRFFHLGWTEDVDADDLDKRRESQDSAWMLERMHHIRAEPGLSVVVPAGWMHAIDEGIFLAEIQEPTDFSIVYEWSATTLDPDQACLQMGWATAAGAVNRSARSPAEIAELVHRTDLHGSSPGLHTTLSSAADGFFALDLLTATRAHPVQVPAGYGIALVLEGTGHLSSPLAHVPAAGGDVLALPHDFGDWTVSGDIQLLIARPADRRPHHE